LTTGTSGTPPPLAVRLRTPAVAGLAGKGAELLSQVLLISLVPAVMGAGDYGEFALALSIVMLASASFAMGGPAILTRYVPAAAAGEREGVARAIVARLSLLRAAQVSAAAAAAIVLATVDPGVFPPLFAAAVIVALALDVAAGVAFQVALGFGHAALFSFRFPLQNLILTGAAVVLYSMGGSDAAVWAIAISSGAVLVPAAIQAAPRLRRAPRDTPIPAGALRFGLLQAVSSLLLQLQHRGGVVAVGLLASSSVQTGFASLAIGISLAGVYAVRQAFTVELPRLVERGGEDVAAAERASRRLSDRLLALVLVPSLAAAIWAGDLLALVAGDEFRNATDALGPALALLPLAPLSALANQVAALRLRPEARLRSTAAGLIVFVLVAAATIPWAGAVGASSALLAGAVTTIAVTPVMLPGALGSRSTAAAVLAAMLVLAAAIASPTGR
jgi:O-antigen/teichoic acid export membrane protein